MNKETFLSRIAAAVDIRRSFLWLLGLSIVLNVVQGISIATLSARSEKTIHIPPQVDKTFWVNSKFLSQEYMEQMGLYVLGLNFNVSPASVNYQGRMFLQVVDPRAYDKLKSRIDTNAAALKRDGVSTIFNASAFVVDDTKFPNRIAFTGQMVTLLTDKRVSTVERTYLVEFGMVSGRTVVLDIRTTSNTDPLGLGTADSVNAAEKSTPLPTEADRVASPVGAGLSSNEELIKMTGNSQVSKSNESSAIGSSTVKVKP